MRIEYSILSFEKAICHMMLRWRGQKIREGTAVGESRDSDGNQQGNGPMIALRVPST